MKAGQSTCAHPRLGIAGIGGMDGIAGIFGMAGIGGMGGNSWNGTNRPARGVTYESHYSAVMITEQAFSQ
jgi:hypothetical protein